MPFWGYSVFGRISLCNPYCKFNLKFRPWRSWAIMRKFFVVDQCTQRHNKKISAGMFGCFWQKLIRPNIQASSKLRLQKFMLGNYLSTQLFILMLRFNHKTNLDQWYIFQPVVCFIWYSVLSIIIIEMFCFTFSMSVFARLAMFTHIP